jgi:signal transduction histidine kinase
MSTTAADFLDGIKRDVAEVKFLIHDLRVDRFVNNIIHFHATLATDLEIYEVEQAQALHADDLAALRHKAHHMRRAYAGYSSAVKNFLPDDIIIAAGRAYIDTIEEICELLLNPLWGRFDRVITFLPDDARSVRSRNHYRNTIRWICGVYYRIEWFRQEIDSGEVREEFDIGDDIIDYTNNVLLGYVVEKGRNRVEIRIDRENEAVVHASRPRLRRTFFNLVMNAVDALAERAVGTINVRIWTHDDEKVSVSVQDNGVGMYPDKIAHLMRDLDTLDGELHSLGFVFVRQTVAECDGDVMIESTPGEGSTVTITLPYLPGRKAPARAESRCSQYGVMPFQDEESQSHDLAVHDSVATGGLPVARNGDWDTGDKEANLGRIILRDYQTSGAQSPGCIFFLGLTLDNEIDAFAHEPYEESWDMGHEDLNPMLYDALIRGRYEEGQDRRPQLILKEPHSIAAYFEIKELDGSRSPERFIQLIHDEYIRIARKLLATGMPSGTPVHLTNAIKYIPDYRTTLGQEPFALSALARLRLISE